MSVQGDGDMLGRSGDIDRVSLEFMQCAWNERISLISVSTQVADLSEIIGGNQTSSQVFVSLSSLLYVSGVASDWSI